MFYYSDERVIQGIKKGELKIYRYLYKRFHKQIIKHVRENSSTNSEKDGEDLYQDTILEVIRLVRSGKYNDKWIFGRTFERIYERRWLKILKERKRKPLSDIEKLQYHISEDVTYGEVSDIYDHVKRLSKECQEIFKYEKQGYSLKEIAGILGINPVTVRKRKSRCIQKLRELMEGDGNT